MAGPAVTAPSPPPVDVDDIRRVDFDDVQGIVRFGHAHMTEACFILLRIADAAAARRWLATAPVTSAKMRDPRPDTALQIALTADGLHALGADAAVMDGFSPEFRTGLAADPDRSRRLGDTGANDPATWAWGSGDRVPHVLAMVFATPDRFAGWMDQLADPVWRQAFTELARLDTAFMGGREPFGFIDGISQPELDWDRRLQPDHGDARYRATTALGEFLLGYPNEYGKYTRRPLLPDVADPQSLLPRAEDAPTLRDFGRNGSYLVLRDLRQSVGAFWRYLAAQAEASGTTARDLAERMVGRRLDDGTPLAPPQGRGLTPAAGDGSPLNGFVFDGDPGGVHCPLGAHIRRANPRVADVPPGTVGFLARLLQTLGLNRQAPRDDLISPVRFHRLLRRGREYGTFVPPEQAAANDAEAGLRFICLNANIARQFEFVQSAWIASTKFNGMTGESDPLLGNREPIPGCPVTGQFTWSRDGGVRRRLADMPQFVTVQGGAYFFLPGIRALRYLATLA